MKNAIKNDDFLILINWVYSKEFSEKILNVIKKSQDLLDIETNTVSEEGIAQLFQRLSFDFKYKNLMETTLKNEGLFVMVDIDKIEDFLVDAYYVYEKIKSKGDDYKGFASMLKIDGMGDIEKTAEIEMNKFINIFETCIRESDFATTNMSVIQKNMLSVMLKDALDKEKYEECAQIRDKMNSMKI